MKNNHDPAEILRAALKQSGATVKNDDDLRPHKNDLTDQIRAELEKPDPEPVEVELDLPGRDHMGLNEDDKLKAIILGHGN